MAQIRNHNFQDPINSFPFNGREFGIVNPGRHRGFDTLIPTSAASFQIGHAASGIKRTNDDNTTQSAFMGVLSTNQGVIIREDAEVIDNAGSDFVMADNAGNPDVRIDWLVCEHEWINTPPGQDAIYYILTGSLLSVPPILSNPEKQIKLGELRIPAGVSDLTTVTYVPEPPTQFGGWNLTEYLTMLNPYYARKDLFNTYTATQRWGLCSAFGTVSFSDWTPVQDGNIIEYTGTGDIIHRVDSSIQTGTEFIIMNLGSGNLQFVINASVGASGSWDRIKSVGITDVSPLTLQVPPGSWVRMKKVTTDHVQITEDGKAYQTGQLLNLGSKNYTLLTADINANAGTTNITGQFGTLSYTRISANRYLIDFLVGCNIISADLNGLLNIDLTPILSPASVVSIVKNVYVGIGSFKSGTTPRPVYAAAVSGSGLKLLILTRDATFPTGVWEFFGQIIIEVAY